jgi:hypothetical protein
MGGIRRLAAASAFAGALAGGDARAQTQAVEIAPFGGYRFGGGFYEVLSGRAVDVDGAPSLGVVLNLPFRDDLLVEGLFTRTEAEFRLPRDLDAGQTTYRVTVDHWQAGGLRDIRPGRTRPFLTGMLGLTRYASAGQNEVRFSFAAGGGVRLFPTPHLGARLEGRLFGTIVDASGDALACTPGVCIGSIDVSVIWQAEFAAGLVLRF